MPPALRYALPAALALVVGLAVGNSWRKPPEVRTVEHEVLKTVTVEDLTAKEQVRSLTTQLEATKRDVHRVVVTRVQKDGSSTKTEVTDTHVTTNTEKKADVTSVAEKHASVTNTANSAVERSTTVTPAQTSWRVGLLVGGSLTPPLVPISGPLTVGIEASRHIAGPFWAGAWVLSSGAGGVSLGVEW